MAFKAMAWFNVHTAMTYVKLCIESFQWNISVALTSCTMLFFFLQLNQTFATGFCKAKLGTCEFSVLQLVIFYQIYQVLKEDQEVLILEKITFKTSTYFRAHQYTCQQQRVQD